MAWALPIALLLGGAAAAESPEQADRKAFYDLVDRYQMFVVPHCAPDTVEAYLAKSAARDAAFVRSLAGTKLADVYARAVADRAKHDRNTVYECTRPPPPPPPPGVVQTEAQRRRALKDEQRRAAAQAKRDRAEHFAEADRLFGEMVTIRDRTVAARRD